MSSKGLVWMIGGEAGYGIATSGYIWAKAMARAGFHVFTNTEYPSLIRGGHNSIMVRAASDEVFAHWHEVDLLVALNRDTIDRHASELAKGACLVYDSDAVKMPPDHVRSDVKIYSVPFAALTKEAGGEKITQNAVGLGASAALAGFSFETLRWVMEETFGGKGKVTEENLKAAELARDYVLKNYHDKPSGLSLPAMMPNKQMLLTGNDAIALGAIKAGLKFHAQYPMTPASSILHYLEAKQRDLGLVAIQPEDEIAGVQMACGAAFAGARSMVATSGGGFSLMVETYGMAGMTELPIVIVEAQRPGPSTGLPTRHEQGDLRFVLSASQGEFPRVVIAPGDVREAFYLTFDAFNLAEKYQLPVIIIADKFLCESYKTAAPFAADKLRIDRGVILRDDEVKPDYARFAVTEDGVSPRVLPGTKGCTYRITSDEHDAEGYLSEETDVRTQQMEKRMRKAEKLAKELPAPVVWGEPDAEITFVTWGSAKGPVHEAMLLLREAGVTSNLLQIVYMSPFHSERVAELLGEARKPILVESNFTGQLGGLIHEKTGIDITDRILKYDGRPFTPVEIFEQTKGMVGR